MSDSLSVLVCGATGQQGGALARVLLDKGYRVRALVRRPDSPEARELERLGAELAEGNFEEPSTIEDAAKGMDAVFIVATPFEAGMEAESRHGIAAADRALGHSGLHRGSSGEPRGVRRSAPGHSFGRTRG